ncbi:MAG: ABC transporter ATP-binding protein [Candidatus Puniceispirillaceae bacterium]
MTAKIKIENLKKSFAGKEVLSGITVEVGTKESLVIIGTSGCGKSVTLKCLLGLIEPDSGAIYIDGENTVGQSRKQREQMLHRFGMTFQFGALFDSLPIWENITFRLRQKVSMSREEARQIALDIVSQLGLGPHVIDQYPAELSGGMQKRVALARAVADKPEILLFDEPTSGLDPITGGVIDNLIKDSVKRLGATAITISHDMASVRRIADKVAMIHKGRVIWCGPVSEMDDTGIAEVDQFVHGKAQGPLTTAINESALERGGSA